MFNLTGRTLGRYQLVEKLGEGGMAVVYKGFDLRLERFVAIKIIPPALQFDKSFSERFDREAKSLARLSHPNIVQIYDYGEQEGILYLVMEFEPGGTLKSRINRPFTAKETANMILPIARALDYAHQRQIVHRDVKPANIIFSEADQPMLSDFGIAKVIGQGQTLTGTGVGIGTPEYMAPEQCKGGAVDQRTDIYALGIILFELLTGRTPFEADTPMAVAYKQVHEPLPDIKQLTPNIPESMEKVIYKALAKDPNDRFKDMRAFIMALENIAAERIIDTIVIPPVPPKPKRTVYIGVGIVAGLLGIIAILYAFDLLPSFPPTVSQLRTPTPGEQAIIEPTPTGKPSTKAPTKTEPNPTKTAAETISPTIPSATISEPTPIYENATLAFYDDFENLSLFDWRKGGNTKRHPGSVEVIPNVVSSGRLIRNTSLPTRQAMVFLISFSEAEFDVILANKPQDWDAYVGVKSNTGYDLVVSKAENGRWIGGQRLNGNLSLTPNNWYQVMIQFQSSTKFYIRVWSKDDSNQFKEQIVYSPTMADKNWYPTIVVTTGRVIVDSYQELEFEE
jgi:serine/threonine-protein kinase